MAIRISVINSHTDVAAQVSSKRDDGNEKARRVKAPRRAVFNSAFRGRSKCRM
jgi:hypothetical protein